MTSGYDENGERVEFNYDFNRWEYPDGDICIDGSKKRICEKCNKPRININGVEDVDFCLQGLTTSQKLFLQILFFIAIRLVCLHVLKNIIPLH